MSAHDTLLRGALRYHQMPERASSCGSMAIDMELMFRGLVSIGPDSRLYVTKDGEAFLASVGRNAERQDHEDGLGPKDEHAVPKADAQ